MPYVKCRPTRSILVYYYASHCILCILCISLVFQESLQWLGRPYSTPREPTCVNTQHHGVRLTGTCLTGQLYFTHAKRGNK